jgi:hypothetical protein
MAVVVVAVTPSPIGVTIGVTIVRAIVRIRIRVGVRSHAYTDPNMDPGVSGRRSEERQHACQCHSRNSNFSK